MFGNRFFLFLLLLASLSCDDDNETSALTFPSVYIKSGIEAVGKLRVFAVTGELKQNSIVSRYNQYDTSYFNGYANYIRNDPGIMDTVYFLNGQSAVLSHESKDLDCLLTKENNSHILTESVVASKCCTYGEVVTRSLPYFMARVKPDVFSEYVYSSIAGNYIFAYSGRRKFVFQESGGQLVAPVILYNLHSKNFDGGFVNNTLQPDFYSILADGDTVALMEYQILYEK
jgi:hypothetical protein